MVSNDVRPKTENQSKQKNEQKRKSSKAKNKFSGIVSPPHRKQYTLIELEEVKKIQKTCSDLISGQLQTQLNTQLIIKVI